VIKPIMSSSGKGQSVVKSEEDMAHAWPDAQGGAVALGKGKVIVEGFVEFDYEITMLTVEHVGGTSFCARSDIRRSRAITAKAGSRTDERQSDRRR